MREWEPSKLQVVEGNWIAIGAKPLHVVDEIFCLIPTDGANCWYLIRLIFGASTVQCRPTKKKEGGGGGVDGGVSVASPMLKSAKKMEKKKKKIRHLGLHTFPSWGVFVLYSNFSLIFGKIIS